MLKSNNIAPKTAGYGFGVLSRQISQYFWYLKGVLIHDILMSTFPEKPEILTLLHL